MTVKILSLLFSSPLFLYLPPYPSPYLDLDKRSEDNIPLIKVRLLFGIRKCVCESKANCLQATSKENWIDFCLKNILSKNDLP